MTAQLDSRPQRKVRKNSPIAFIQKHSQKIIRPVVAIAILLVIWQILCLSPASNLPSPIKVFQETWDPLIIKPFFDNGGTDKGFGITNHR
jgi:nitrate/nitrite transport system permease protein